RPARQDRVRPGVKKYRVRASCDPWRPGGAMATRGKRTKKRARATRASTKRAKAPDAGARRQLTEYRRKRDFAVTPEPSDTAPETPEIGRASCRRRACNTGV